MKCPKCQTELSEEHAEIIGVAPSAFDGSGESFDIIVTCPECGHRRNGFLPESEMIDLD